MIIPVDNNYTTTTSGGGWDYVTAVPSSAHTRTYGGYTVTTASNTATTSKINHGIVHVDDVNLAGLGSLKEILENQKFLALPQNLDVENPTIADAVTQWYKALEQLKRSHEQLQILAKLTNE